MALMAPMANRRSAMRAMVEGDGLARPAGRLDPANDTAEGPMGPTVGTMWMDALDALALIRVMSVTPLAVEGVGPGRVTMPMRFAFGNKGRAIGLALT